jgi:hypothetical protein
VLYEGYVLWPYRRSALKNQQRWTFGGVFPPEFSRTGSPSDRAAIQTQCLLETDDDARLDVTVRYLHVVDRQVRDAAGPGRPVDALVVGDREYLSWEEATERQVSVGGSLAELRRPLRADVGVAAGEQREPIHDADGRQVGEVVRSWEPLSGVLTVLTQPVQPGLARVTVRVESTTPWPGGGRPDALRRTFAAAHVVLHCAQGAFVSAVDPPPELREPAAACSNEGLWPVLVGADEDRRTVLAPPLILGDYPAIAPESPGDLFDGGEIDELLVLNVLSLTQDEQREMAASDPRTREILERCAGLSPEQLARLHGTFRDPLGPITGPIG